MGMGQTCNEAVIGGLYDGSQELDDVAMAEGAEYLGLREGGKEAGIIETTYHTLLKEAEHLLKGSIEPLK